MKSIRNISLFILLLLSAVIAGDLEAQQQYSAALRALTERAEAEEAKAIYEMARLYETGYDSIPRDSIKSDELYLKAARLHYPPAMNIIGFRYYHQNYLDSALYWINKAAEAGDATAFSNLGYLYTQIQEFNKAEQWLIKGAEAGVPSAMSQLGDFKRRGLTAEPDTIAAIELYDRAIEGGDWDSQFKLLAMMGYKWKSMPGPEALQLGLKYYVGHAPVAGVELLERAAEEGEGQAMALLGDAFSRGIGVEYNPRKALELFHEGALAGNASAQFLIAELLDFYPDEFEESAEYWREKAMNSGVNNADEAYEYLFEYHEPNNLH